ncbi:hypothetical protein KIL84_008910 [Mauremys mutica]|uniref:Uncharacterized protein n=1 Tax=Mauremys mutica TaxID=74926 RepID=A0A9D3X6Q7_9SAUR|nr:hypothetical protein KIL84_008910 [Mauremys mutica]
MLQAPARQMPPLPLAWDSANSARGPITAVKRQPPAAGRENKVPGVQRPPHRCQSSLQVSLEGRSHESKWTQKSPDLITVTQLYCTCIFTTLESSSKRRGKGRKLTKVQNSAFIIPLTNKSDILKRGF